MYLPPPLSEQKLEILLVFSHFLPLQLTVSLSLTSITLYGFAFHTAKEFLTILNITGHKFFMHTSGFPYSMSLLSNYPLYLDCNCFNFQYCKFLCWFPMETKLSHTLKKTPRIYFSALIILNAAAKSTKIAKRQEVSRRVPLRSMKIHDWAEHSDRTKGCHVSSTYVARQRIHAGRNWGKLLTGIFTLLCTKRSIKTRT